MTYEEALKRIKLRYENTKDYSDSHWEGSERREHREWVEEMECAIEALDKQVPMKPKNILHLGDKHVYKFGNCPYCGDGVNYEFAHCPKCGQALNWTEDENESKK